MKEEMIKELTKLTGENNALDLKLKSAWNQYTLKLGEFAKRQGKIDALRDAIKEY